MKYYIDIDLPLHNWLKIQDGDIEYSRIDLEQGTEELDVENCMLIKDSYYTEFGVGPEHLRVLELQKELAEAKLDWIIENDDFILNRIGVLERELKDILERPVESDIDEHLIVISKWMGYGIKKKETTVREFYKRVKLFAAEMEARKKQTANGKN